MSCAEWRFCPRCAAALPPLEAAPLRCAAPGCGFEFWNNPLPVVAVIAETADGVVLAHKRAWPARLFAPITGYVEAREDPRAAAHRELREELGVDATSLELVGAYRFAAANQLIIALHARVDGAIRLGDELDAFRIVPVDRLQAWDFGTGPAVRDFLDRRRSAATN